MVSIRLAEPGDGRAVRAVFDAVQLKEERLANASRTGFLLTSRTAEEYSALAGQKLPFFVAEEEGRVVGFLLGRDRAALEAYAGADGPEWARMLAEPTPEVVYVDQIGVVPEGHGKGIAAALLDSVRRGQPRAVLFATIAHAPVRNLRSIGFFAGKQGFQCVAEWEWDGRGWGLYRREA